MVKLGVNDEGILVRRASLVEFNEGSASAAVRKPVPVIFGTRMVTPVVTAWGGRHRGTTELTQPHRRFWIPGGRSGISTNPSPPIEQWQVLIEMSMRMVLCVGPCEPIRRFLVGDQEFHPWTTAYPAVTPYFDVGSRPTTRPDPQAYIRYFSTPEDLQLFGGLQGGGGIGFLISTAQISSRYQFGAEFLLCFGNDRESVVDSSFRTTTYTPLSLRQETGSPTQGCSSLLFYDFNFGSTEQLNEWRVQVKRIRRQTDYNPQWYPEASELTSIQTTANQYFFIVYPRWSYGGSTDEQCTGWSATRFGYFISAVQAFLDDLGNQLRANPTTFPGTVTVELLGVAMSQYGSFAQNDYIARRPRLIMSNNLNVSTRSYNSFTQTIRTQADINRLKNFLTATARSNQTWISRYRIRWLNHFVEQITARWNSRRAYQNRLRKIEQSTIIAWWGGLQTFNADDRFEFKYTKAPNTPLSLIHI